MAIGCSATTGWYGTKPVAARAGDNGWSRQPWSREYCGIGTRPKVHLGLHNFVQDLLSPTSAAWNSTCIHLIFGYRVYKMKRTNIVIDNDLVSQGLKLTGLKTQKELVHHALVQLVRRESQLGLLKLVA